MRKRRNLPPLSGNEFMAYLGFSDGKPFTDHSRDGYDADSSVAELFVCLTDARRRFADVRRVRITVEEATR